MTWASTKFRHYLNGYHRKVHTDHEALEWLAQARYKNAKLERWATGARLHKALQERL